MQRLKAAQNRVDKLQKEAEVQQNQNTQLQQNKAPEQPQNAAAINALDHTAAMNLYNNKTLANETKESAFQFVGQNNNSKNNPNAVSELEKAQTDLQTNQKAIDDKKMQPENKNLQDPELKDDPIFKQLPDELKQRPDIKNLIQNVDKEALMNPEQLVSALVDQSLGGSRSAYQKLNDYSQTPYDKLQASAAKGIEKVFDGADNKPLVLEMIAATPSDKSDQAAAKLLNLSSYNPRAQQGIEKLASNGAINLTKVANNAKDLNPADTASSLNMLLMRGNLSKSDRQGAVGVLGDIAKENATGSAGSIAAKGLTKAVKSEPLDIARQAAVSLKEAATNGNDAAMSGLQKLVKSDDPSRAQLALTQLGEISMSGGTNSSAALETVKKVAESPNTNGQVRTQAVETLGKVAAQGGTNSQDAVQTMSNIAVNKSNPANATAFNEIGKLNNATVGQTQNTIQNPKNETNLSDSDTFKKVMALQQQMKTASQQPTGLFSKFAMQFAPAM